MEPQGAEKVERTPEDSKEVSSRKRERGCRGDVLKTNRELQERN